MKFLDECPFGSTHLTSEVTNVSTKEETLKEFKKHLSKLNEIDAIHPTQY